MMFHHDIACCATVKLISKMSSLPSEHGSQSAFPNNDKQCAYRSGEETHWRLRCTARLGLGRRDKHFTVKQGKALASEIVA
jgi:hypothetical protein